MPSKRKCRRAGASSAPVQTLAFRAFGSGLGARLSANTVLGRICNTKSNPHHEGPSAR